MSAYILKLYRYHWKCEIDTKQKDVNFQIH